MKSTYVPNDRKLVLPIVNKLKNNTEYLGNQV
jgi:hypothetical protein